MTTTVLHSGDKLFIFEFSFSPSDPIPSPPMEPVMADYNTDSITSFGAATVSPYLEVVAYRNDYPEQSFYWAGNLNSGERIPIAVPLPLETFSPPTETDDNGCKGEFYLYQNSYTGEKFVWFNLQFGSGYEAIYEGCMVRFPTDNG